MKAENEVIENLRLYMVQNNLSQQQTAVLLGCSQAGLSQWLNAKRHISTPFYIAIMRLLEGGGNE